MLLECIRERQMDVEVLVDMKRVKLEQCIHLLQFENEANQVGVGVVVMLGVVYLPFFLCLCKRLWCLFVFSCLQ